MIASGNLSKIAIFFALFAAQIILCVCRIHEKGIRSAIWTTVESLASFVIVTSH
jgi:hypothetical protein